jgi:hypothetical protein
MRTRTILIPLLALYAAVLSGYLVFRFITQNKAGAGRSSSAGVELPVAPPPAGTTSSPLSGGDLMARVQIENELRYTDLQSFVCSEHMERFRARLNGENARQIDSVSAQVSFENGMENYSGIQQGNRQRASMSDIPGAWSEGEFGTLLRQTRTLLASEPLTQQAAADENGKPAVLFSLNVSGDESPWQLTVDSKKYRLPFRTDVLVDQATGRILVIKRTSTAMPPSLGISEIQWSVNLKPAQLDGREWLLPASGEYSILYQKTNRREWNQITFADYHHYTASSVMHF